MVTVAVLFWPPALCSCISALHLVLQVQHLTHGLGRRRCQAREAAAQKGPGEQPAGPSCSSGCTRHPVGRLCAVWKRLGSEPFQEGHDLSSVLFQNNETYLMPRHFLRSCQACVLRRQQAGPRAHRGASAGGAVPGGDSCRPLTAPGCFSWTCVLALRPRSHRGRPSGA